MFSVASRRSKKEAVIGLTFVVTRFARLHFLVFLLIINWVCNSYATSNLDWRLIPNQPDVRVALFTGTFDPPHRAHLQIVKDVIQQRLADFVIMLPNEQALHKPNASPFLLRYEMTKALFRDFDRVAIPSVEDFDPSRYSHQFLDLFSKTHNQVQIFAVMGSDVAAQAHDIFETNIHWMGLAQVFLVHLRDGVDQGLSREIKGRRVIPFSSFQGKLSSTGLRNLVRNGNEDLLLLNQYTDPEVVRIIRRNHLYQTQNSLCSKVFDPK
ncbi:MAG: hypothetical protein RMK80_07085 [Pseudobdellovibrionaceae bacterium]|nr:hypothetical protein [Pseudobdellovibrionaceae bacterium]